MDIDEKISKLFFIPADEFGAVKKGYIAFQKPFPT